ncbi:hypothetical protein [Shinella zoogloeoides]|uniref:hypothetical protein n=1 Tax=Shinella zoogloeoides TaxID=352475 RepID=UPI0028AD0332|nr:hypothetical protein [Shinella zoogloeoides]
MSPPETDGDLRGRVVSAEQRLTALEVWQRQRDIESARHDEKWNAMEARIDNRFSGLEKSVHSIQASLAWINRLIIGGIIAGVIGFLIRGGFAP